MAFWGSYSMNEKCDSEQTHFERTLICNEMFTIVNQENNLSESNKTTLSENYKTIFNGNYQYCFFNSILSISMIDFKTVSRLSWTCAGCFLILWRIRLLLLWRIRWWSLRRRLWSVRWPSLWKPSHSWSWGRRRWEFLKNKND